MESVTIQDVMKKHKRSKNINNLHKRIFISQVLLIVALTIVIACTGVIFNTRAEAEKRDQNLKNIAEAVARLETLTSIEEEPDIGELTEYLDALKASLTEVDVISVVDENGIRLYHSNHELIGVAYDGTMPDFSEADDSYYAYDEDGPSGTQRRAYAAIYDDNGNYAGFVMAIMLSSTIKNETRSMLLLYAGVTLAALIIELIISYRVSSNIRKQLMGYEPDTFSAMYKIRDNILETIDEGIIAVDAAGEPDYMNEAAEKMLDPEGNGEAGEHAKKLLEDTLENGEKELGMPETRIPGADILMDRIPVLEDGEITGAIGILHDRTEYTQMVETIAGTKFLVDSMRANNHDFTNKLHVILGLIQMDMKDEAMKYIENITLVQKQTIDRIMHSALEPSIAALLIGKAARASELNVNFIFDEGSSYLRADCPLPENELITVIGNFIDNALDAMDTNNDPGTLKELEFGIYSRPGSLLITVGDTGCGIPEENKKHIFEKGFSTKGEGRGTGLYQTGKIVESLGGSISFTSEEGVGTSFEVTFTAGSAGRN